MSSLDARLDALEKGLNEEVKNSASDVSYYERQLEEARAEHKKAVDNLVAFREMRGGADGDHKLIGLGFNRVCSCGKWTPPLGKVVEIEFNKHWKEVRGDVQ